MTKRDSVVMSVSYSFTLRHSGDYLPAPNMLLLDKVKFQIGHNTTASQGPKTSAEDATKIPARADLALIVSSGLRRIYRDVRHAAKLLAAAIEIEPKTARSYLEGDRAPCAWNLLQIMAENREIRADIDRLVDRLEAANKAAKKPENKINQSSHCRRDYAEPRSGIRAEPRLGESQEWSDDYFSIWPRIFLVDVP